MRRLKILFFWLFVNRNNVGFTELLQFLTKPTIGQIAKKHIKAIEEKDDFEVAFNTIQDRLHWPKGFSLYRLYQVIAETFDKKDWHYYQKEKTEIEIGEILLDIGTAEGLFPLTVINQCSHIYMIEPSRIFNQCLQKTFKNHIDKISLYNVAVGNIDGEIPFDENSLDGKVTSDAVGAAYTISINRIDTLLKDKKITYLKADIEGFEQEMLKGAEQVIKNNKPKIAITTYHTENDPDEIIALIKSFVPEYKHYIKGIYEQTPKPVLIHFWV